MKNRKLIKEMRKRGWSHELTRKGHIKFTFDQTGDFLICPGTASDVRSLKNMYALAKRIEEGRYVGA